MVFIIISGLSGAGKKFRRRLPGGPGVLLRGQHARGLISNFAGLCMAGAGTGKYSRVAW